MSSSENRVSPQSLAEVSFVISRIAGRNLRDFAVNLPDCLRLLWVTGRSLERDWTESLEKWNSTESRDLHELSRLTSQVLAVDMLIRTWGTILVAIDSRLGGKDASILARNVTNGIGRVRNAVLTRLLEIHGDQSDLPREIDRMFRRHQRWVDVLMGTMFRSDMHYEFAYDQARSRDFADEIALDRVTGPNPADHLVSAGLRMNFVRFLSAEPYSHAGPSELVRSIVSQLPQRVFRREGLPKSLLELRIMADEWKTDPDRKASSGSTSTSDDDYI